MILVIDNYDSFVFNLDRYLRRLGQTTRVVRNDQITAEEVEQLAPNAIVFSPGPCTPREAGESLEIVRRNAGAFPMLGVCLGHQIIAEAMGGLIVQAAHPMHGRTSLIQHDGAGVFRGLPTPLEVCRYHSLVVQPDSLPDCLQASAHTADGVLMAFRHRTRPIVGLQFHPEAILTRCGYQMLAGFLRIAGLPAAPAISDEWTPPLEKDSPTEIAKGPITF